MRIIFSFFFLLTSYCATAQNVGIGTANPTARLHVTDSSVAFSVQGEATIFPGNPPISGAGRRMMWYPDKGAFRTGYVSADQWDKANVGFYSFASGYDARANGGFSTALGGSTIANGSYSTAMGYSSIASGFGSAALGFRSSAKAYGSISLGALNDDTDNPDPNNAAPLDRIFQIGIGDINTLSRSNALTVLRNGRVGIGTTSPWTSLHIEANNPNPFIISGNSSFYISWAEDGNFRGYLGSYSGNPEDIDFGTYTGNNGKIHFTTNNSPKMTIINSGHVGIGNVDPTATLDVIRGTGTNGTALFRGTQHFTHFNHSTNEDTYVRAGKDNANVVINDIPGGKTGIGYANPAYLLDVNGRMRIRSGGNNGTSAGIYLNNNSNIPAAFIGMEDDTHVGLFGNNGAGWKLSMNTQNGALRINGSEGSTGQVLSSNGGTGAPSWTNPLSDLYSNMTEYVQSANLAMAPQVSYSVPGLSNISLVITSPSKVIISASLEVERSACGGCGSSEANLFIQMTPPLTNVAGSTDFVFPLESVTPTIGMKFLTLNPNTYTIHTYIFNGVGSNATAKSGRLNIIVVEQ